jgi:hypothetical protein
MDKGIIPLLFISLLLFSLCLESGPSKDLETTQELSTTSSAVSEQTKAKETTTLFVLPTIYSETPSSILRDETTLRTTSTGKATTTTISASRGCSKCRNSNLTCGEIMKDNGTDVICTCIKALPNGEYSSCYLSKGTICAKCYDGTACGQNNLKGALCRCDESVGGGMYLACFLGKPKCTKCSDGTACGNVSKSGMGCFCDPVCHGPGCVEWDTCDLK